MRDIKEDLQDWELRVEGIKEESGNKYLKAMWAFDDAKLLYENYRYDGAINRLYFAMSNCIYAVLNLDYPFEEFEDIPRTELFIHEYLEPGLISKELAADIEGFRTYCIKGCFDSCYRLSFGCLRHKGGMFTKEVMDYVGKFMESVERYLKEKGVEIRYDRRVWNKPDLGDD